ncbi:predicted protein [Sclerotinia sclerotiorum 1980 UF-70]|uniref:Uncharacterized protein n=1 Tax=Sclerotinia sclerotiorum (strain ATCC 18683 / 1980 / Ss-1) TaxID=665079 RepID=A7EIV3_SCLS1|nr:predicted protein [Sclerotinia sclerotiorum 1980 UF-70]EDO02769.1 predicted protein [Sclerotinia sclerotiorum 1980 UF-70]
MAMCRLIGFFMPMSYMYRTDGNPQMQDELELFSGSELEGEGICPRQMWMYVPQTGIISRVGKYETRNEVA